MRKVYKKWRTPSGKFFRGENAKGLSAFHSPQLLAMYILVVRRLIAKGELGIDGRWSSSCFPALYTMPSTSQYRDRSIHLLRTTEICFEVFKEI